MKTTKPIATISYNSEAFLRYMLEYLLDEKYIVFWAYIPHMKEEDEEKDHFHVYVEPNKPLDLLWLKDQFKEKDLSGNPKPLGCINFKPSKWVDWYYYGLHDKAYLLNHGETRKYSYTFADVRTSDTTELTFRVSDTPKPFSKVERALDMISRGYSDTEIAVALGTPLERIHYFAQGINDLRTYRGAYSPHSEDLDEDTDA